MARAIRTESELFDLLAQGEAFDDGEAVDGLAHALQCAALLAEVRPDDRELQIAGLVHDIGTVLGPGRADTHAATGAMAVAPLLGDRVGRLVGLHDVAKRWLVTVDPVYRYRLSARSVETLREQGGLMDPTERAAFEALECFADVVALRRADDAAKVPGRGVPPLEAWRPVVDQVAAGLCV